MPHPERKKGIRRRPADDCGITKPARVSVANIEHSGDPIRHHVYGDIRGAPGTEPTRPLDPPVGSCLARYVNNGIGTTLWMIVTSAARPIIIAIAELLRGHDCSPNIVNCDRSVTNKHAGHILSSIIQGDRAIKLRSGSMSEYGALCRVPSAACQRGLVEIGSGRGL